MAVVPAPFAPSKNIMASRARSGGIGKHAQLAHGTKIARRKRGVARAKAAQNPSFRSARDDECRMLSAFERGVGEGDARLRRCADHLSRPSPAFLQHRLSRKKRGE